MPEGNATRVLIVDDDPSTLTLLERHLRRAGYDVVKALNGVEAIGILAAEGPRVVITDWMMPEMDGLELCRAIRTHEGIPFAYVIIVTAQQTTEDRLVEAFDAGVDDYLCKPVMPRELVARLRAGVRIVKLQEELDHRNLELHRFNAKMQIANEKMEIANQKLNLMATTDELTGLVNRREAMTHLSDCWAAGERHGDPLSCILIDIDHFKNFNDMYGHSVGDLVLKGTAETLRSTARRAELVARIGGEEFLVVCSRSTEEMAAVGAERLRQAVEANLVRYGNLKLQVTISLGVAERTPEMCESDDLIRTVDRALYTAKNAGRNTVARASDATRADRPAVGEAVPNETVERPRVAATSRLELRTQT